MQGFTIAKRYHTATGDIVQGEIVIDRVNSQSFSSAVTWAEVINTVSRLPYTIIGVSGDDGQHIKLGQSNGEVRQAA